MRALRRVTEIQNEMGSSSTYSRSTSSDGGSFSTFVNAAGCTGSLRLGTSSLVHARPGVARIQRGHPVIVPVQVRCLVCISRTWRPQHRLPARLSDLIPFAGSAFLSLRAHARVRPRTRSKTCERSGRVTILRGQARSVEGRSRSSLPARSCFQYGSSDADEHSLNHIFRLFVESVRVRQSVHDAPSNQRASSGARYIITISNPLACGKTLSGTRPPLWARSPASR